VAISKYLQKKAWISGKTVIGIDPGKDRHQAVVIDGHGIMKGKPFSFGVNQKGFNEKLWNGIRMATEMDKPEDTVFAVETSCNLWVTITDYLRRQGYTVVLVSPLSTHHARPLMNHDFTKTDPKDALLIASNAQNGNYDHYREFSAGTKRLHQLSLTYSKLMKDRTRMRMRIRALMEVVFPEYLKCIDVCTETSLYLLQRYFMPEDFLRMDIKNEASLIKKLSRNNYDESLLYRIRKQARGSIGADKTDERDVLRLTLDSYITLYRGINEQMRAIHEKMTEIAKESVYFEVITSIKGIREGTAARFMGECRIYDELPFSHYKQIEKLAGLNLRLNQSGKHVGARHISHIGNKRLLNLLYLMTTQVARHIPEVRIRFLKRQMQKRHYRKNIVACISQLLKLLTSLLKKKRGYEYYPERMKEMKELEAEYMGFKVA